MSTKAKTKRGTTRRRPTTLRGAVKKAAATQRESVEQANARIVDAIRDIVHAQVGVYAEIYDQVNARVTKVRTETPKHWQRFVRRGEKVQRDVEKAQTELMQNLEQARTDLQRKLTRAQRELRSRVEKLRAT